MGEPLYANAVNLSGLWSDTPVVVTRHDESGTYWDASGNLEVLRMGTTTQEGCITFASDKATEVVMWTLGVKAAMKIINNWSR